MKVLMVAHTTIRHSALSKAGYVDHYTRLKDRPPSESATVSEWSAWYLEAVPGAIDELHEAAGRGCYESWHRPNPDTLTNGSYLANIIDSEHYSVLGHGHVTFYVAGVSRALLLELEPHQQRSNINLSVLSQRFVNHGVGSDIGVVAPPVFSEEQARDLRAWHEAAQIKYDAVYTELRAAGWSLKEARGAARAYLPENTETRFFVTGSIRAWRDIIVQRLSDAADAEIREFAREVLTQLGEHCHNSVQDLLRQHGIEGW